MRVGNVIFSFKIWRVREAYGVSSFASKSQGTHYLLMDFDDLESNAQEEISRFLAANFPDSNAVKYRTTHGFHVLVFKEQSFEDTLLSLLRVPHIDVGYVASGLKRGYWFLEQENRPLRNFRGIKLNYMKIERRVK